MRLFVAADIDPQTREQLTRAGAALQRVLATAAVAPRVTWVKSESAHVTLRFIGEVSTQLGTAVEQALQEPLAVEAFEVQWDHLGTFPGGRRPRVVWVGCSRGGSELQALAAAVDARLAPVVGPGESRPFNAHLTIGRVKEAGSGTNWAGAIADATFRPTVTRVDHVTLYSSRTLPDGPTYTALCRVAFAGR